MVISIIGFLATAAMLAFNIARLKAGDVRRKSDIKQIQTAIELCADNHGGIYPDTTGGSGIYSLSSVKCLGLKNGETCFAGRHSGFNSLYNDLSPFIKAPTDPKRENEIFDTYLYSSACHITHSHDGENKPCIYWQPEGDINDQACAPGKKGNSGGDVCGYNCYFCTLRVGD